MCLVCLMCLMFDIFDVFDVFDVFDMFFMRTGADCLSKWVGEAERQLKLLFEQAKAQQPAIIFFDEIDGLAPVRSTRQDHCA